MELLVEAWILRAIAPTIVKLGKTTDTKLSELALAEIGRTAHFSSTLRRLHLKLVGRGQIDRELGSVDVRPWKMGWWKEQVILYTKERRTHEMPHPGDLVGWVLYRESGGRKTVID